MGSKQEYQSNRDIDEVITIANCQQLSSVLDVSGMTLVGIRMPASFTGTGITFQESDSASGTFQDIYNSNGAVITCPVGASRTILFNPADFAGVQFLKIKSGSSEAGQRSITCLLRVI